MNRFCIYMINKGTKTNKKKQREHLICPAVMQVDDNLRRIRIWWNQDLVFFPSPQLMGWVEVLSILVRC